MRLSGDVMESYLLLQNRGHLEIQTPLQYESAYRSRGIKLQVSLYGSSYAWVLDLRRYLVFFLVCSRCKRAWFALDCIIEKRRFPASATKQKERVCLDGRIPTY